jgi:hypothetical protein
MKEKRGHSAEGGPDAESTRLDAKDDRRPGSAISGLLEQGNSQQLGISPYTVTDYVSTILERLGVVSLSGSNEGASASAKPSRLG